MTEEYYYVKGDASEDLNESIADAMYHFSQQQAGLPDDRKKMSVPLMRDEYRELAKIVRSAINGAGCFVFHRKK